MVMGSSTSLLRVGGRNPFMPRDCFWNAKYLMQRDFRYLQNGGLLHTQQEGKTGRILCFVQRKFALQPDTKITNGGNRLT